MGKIVDIKAMEVLDSRGNPTVKADVILDSSTKGSGIVPSGASKGQKEAIELRDNDKNRFQGRGVKIAVKNIHEKILPKIIGLDCREQAFIDKVMIDIDGTKNKSKLGANAILAVSMAVCNASANEIELPFYKYIGGCNAKELPVPMMNIINGGIHADNNLDIQEFMIMPVGFRKFSDAMQAGVKIFHTLKSTLKKNNLNISVGDEGGFAPNLNSNEDAILLIIEAIEQSGYKPGKDVFLALDVASSEFYKGGKYFFENKKITSSVLIEYYEKLINKYPVLSIEDGLSENDWKGWEEITKRLGKKVQLVGDDLFVTNPEILKEGIKKSIANSILIKLNQIGTITETLDTIETAKKAGYTAIVSHRSGETEDTTIADLAVGCNTGFIKTGSLSRTDRIAKYNRLLEIEGELEELAVFKGLESFYNIKNIRKSY